MTTLGPQRIDTRGQYTLVAKDAAGVVVDLTGVSPIAVDLCPGEGAASVATLSASVLGTPTDGKVSLSVDPAALVGLAPGLYTLYVTGSASGVPLDLALDYTLALEGGVNTNVPGVASRARLERSIVLRCRSAMKAAGMMLTTAGDNPDLDDVIGWSAAQRGVTPQAGFDLLDADFAVMPRQTFYDLADLCEYRIVATAIQGWDRATVQVGMNRIEWGNLLGSLNVRLAELETQMRNRFGFGVASPVASSIGLRDARRWSSSGEFSCRDGFAPGEWCE